MSRKCLNCEINTDKNPELSPEGELRKGYTTGSCATAAAKAATYLIFKGSCAEVSIMTPKGIKLDLEVLEGQIIDEKTAKCGIRKNSGDDPDITDGVMIYAKVSLNNDSSGKILIDGGEGVGRVTLPGLSCKVGEAAINPTPRKTIEAAVSEILQKFDYKGGAFVEISLPQGVELAKRTFNPKLGIVGGLSIIGTSGIVEPMSEQALIDTIKVEMSMRKATGCRYLLITPGNYGETFLKENFDVDRFYSVKCSNFIGNALDFAEQMGFSGILFMGHIGKLSKLAGGIMNTHSKYADSRMEIMAAYAAKLGAKRELIEEIFNCVTTDSAYEKIKEADALLCENLMKLLMERIIYHLKARTHDTLEVAAVMFSNKYGLLAKSDNADEFIKKLEKTN
ncbi:MAG: cobalamin biosynthesis protein CbiD [Clostridiales bacterium]|nr:cobalamin biosynthesis protein CbiD [Clostridiales bacterium]